MRVLVLHNQYRYAGGEDVVVARERDLLLRHGHDVRIYTVSNDVVQSTWDEIVAAWRTPYSRSARRRVAVEIEAFRPDLVHVHNFFPLLSPSIFDACVASNLPVVQSLHNYRLLCLNASLRRDGHLCEDCIGKSLPWPGIVHGCYRGSRGASAAVAAMLVLHRFLRSWAEKVDVYIALTEFARAKFVQGGLPVQKVVVKPNFIYPDPGFGESEGRYGLFVGRLVADKGVRTLLSAWEQLAGTISLKVVGDGPLAREVVHATERTTGLEWLGQQSNERVLELMKHAEFVVLPSVYYECFPLVIVEAFAVGLPVIASNVGSLSSLIDHHRTGLHFNAGDPTDLAEKVKWLGGHPHARDAMRSEARREFERLYTGERNYQILMDIYERAMKQAHGRIHASHRHSETFADRSGNLRRNHGEAGTLCSADAH